jgi:hypothetical protein
MNFILFADSLDLEKLVKDNPSANYFIDEAPVSEKASQQKHWLKCPRIYQAETTCGLLARVTNLHTKKTQIWKVG